jgi:hypothetical protein
MNPSIITANNSIIWLIIKTLFQYIGKYSGGKTAAPSLGPPFFFALEMLAD